MTESSDRIFSTDRMSHIFSAEARIQAMLRFLAGLARAEARAGVIPAPASAAIIECCAVSRFDVAALQREVPAGGTLALTLVRRLTERVPEAARGFVHWGSTSQDVMDTATVLQAREGLAVLAEDLYAIAAACATLAHEHAERPMAGRTLLQHALPITFGLKAAQWLSLATRQLTRLDGQRGSLPLQFGGAVGTLAALGEHGLRVGKLLAEELDLVLPDLSWHADRDRMGELAGALSLAAGAMAKIASDVVLLMQTEVGELGEPRPGRSSAMPHKRNPAHATEVLAAARLASGSAWVVLSGMVQEHERGVGGWQAEGVALPNAFRFTGSALAHARALVEGLEPDLVRMEANLDVTRGRIMAEALVMALAPHVGRDQAYELVADACERADEKGLDLSVAVREDERIAAVLSEHELQDALDPRAYLGSTAELIRRALRRFEIAASGRDER